MELPLRVVYWAHLLLAVVKRNTSNNNNPDNTKDNPLVSPNDTHSSSGNSERPSLSLSRGRERDREHKENTGHAEDEHDDDNDDEEEAEIGQSNEDGHEVSFRVLARHMATSLGTPSSHLPPHSSKVTRAAGLLYLTSIIGCICMCVFVYGYVCVRVKACGGCAIRLGGAVRLHLASSGTSHSLTLSLTLIRL